MVTILHGLLLGREDQEMRIMNPAVRLKTKAFPLNECLDFLYGQLREGARARWIKSCAVIGYLSEIHGAILRDQDYPLCPARKVFPKSQPYNKSFIDQAFSVKMVGYWSRFFFLRVYRPRLSLGPWTQKTNSANIHPYHSMQFFLPFH